MLKLPGRTCSCPGGMAQASTLIKKLSLLSSQIHHINGGAVTLLETLVDGFRLSGWLHGVFLILLLKSGFQLYSVLPYEVMNEKTRKFKFVCDNLAMAMCKIVVYNFEVIYFMLM